MIKVVGVRFRTAGKIYYFDPRNYEISLGSHVIVETARGVEFGTVMIAPKELEPEQERNKKVSNGEEDEKNHGAVCRAGACYDPWNRHGVCKRSNRCSK